ALLALFLGIESRVQAPLVPLGLFRLRNIRVSNVVGVFWAAAMFAWFFLSALYLQLVLGYSPLQVGLSFLPANLIMGAFSIGLSSGLVNTSFMMGGALGLAVLASIAASRTHSLRVGGSGELSALTGGYHLAFLVGAAFAATAAVIGGTLLRETQPMGAHEAGHGATAATETSQGGEMGKVFAEVSVSLDGYVAGPTPTLANPLDEGGDPLHEWAFGLTSLRQ